MMITHKICMDLVRRGGIPRVYVVQGDALTRAVEITLRCQGALWEIPGEPGVLIRYRRPDGVTGEYDTLVGGTPAGTANGAAVTIILAREVLAVPGDVVLVVTLLDGSRELSTFEFLISVAPNLSRNILGNPEAVSVSGMIPAPEAAQAGQILVIDEVDEYGLIQSTKAVDALPGTIVSDISLDRELEGASRYRITMNDGSVHYFDVTHGKSAYAYALEGGYTGSEAEFTRKMALPSPIHVGPQAPEDPEVILWVDTAS